MKLGAITTKDPVDNPAKPNDLISHLKADTFDIDLDPRTGLIAASVGGDPSRMTIIHVSSTKFMKPFVEKKEEPPKP